MVRQRNNISMVRLPKPKRVKLLKGRIFLVKYKRRG